jgi:uncharacterized lipoprotein YmbA
MTMRRIAPLLALLLACCGSSPPTHYFMLAVVPQAHEEYGAISTPIMVASVNVPPSLDRRSMVRRTGVNTVVVSEQDRWAAPLGAMIQRVLAQDLAMRLPTGQVVLPESPPPPHTNRIVVSLAQFEPTSHGNVVLNGSWSLLAGDQEKTALYRNIALETGLPSTDAKGQALAMSRLVGQLASHIAETLATTTRLGQSGTSRKSAKR